MKISKPVISLILITFIYFSGLLVLDLKNNIFQNVNELLHVLPILFLVGLLSWWLRFARWHWLLFRSGYSIPHGMGFLAYIAGFAFTVTPGKVGELIRIRYFKPMKVPSKIVLSAFIYERSLDVIAVLILSIFIASSTHFFSLAMVFVFILLVVITVLIYHSKWLLRINRSKMTRMLVKGLSNTKRWLNLKDMAISFILGLMAWALVAFSFVWMLIELEISVPFFHAFGMFPLSMLVGAASALPGGVGSTEAALIALLSLDGVSLDFAILAAIGIRIGTLWVAVLAGIISMVFLELYKTDYERTQGL